LFDRFAIEEFGWRVAENCLSARILDTEDLHSLRLGRQKHSKKNDYLKLKIY
jgi:hypothetical protein